jgi:ATP-dependent exoDNAse (exonuclease V) beta subunit
MSKGPAKSPPPDQAQRDKALDPNRSILVQAPAGSGKTTLLAERFLRLLADVEEPGQVVAITFTKAAAAEMRNRILDKLTEAEPIPIARRALEHSQELGWNLLDLPTQLRISTIDSFCRELALQQPLLSRLGDGLDIAEQPTELYRRAARRTLEEIGKNHAALSTAIETVLLWRDNNWREMEDLLVEMLENRDHWMQEFVLEGEPNWETLRVRLERPFAYAAGRDPSSTLYTDKEWEIVRACFTLLRRAAGELEVVFAETAAVDYIEVAQLALTVLKGEDGLPTDAAMAVADGIRHMLVDEFQDTSRRQHQLLAHLIAAWPEREGRTCFVVGDPMQSIYFFRGADAELFPRVRDYGLEIPGDQPQRLETVQLSANFRTTPALVNELNGVFRRVFATDDGSGVKFTQAEPGREEPHSCWAESSGPRNFLHLEFVPQTPRGHPIKLKDKETKEDDNAQNDEKKQIKQEREEAQAAQTGEILDLIRGCLECVPVARAKGEKLRIAVLGRTRKSLAVIANALREDGIPFLAVDLEALSDRPEVLDALLLGRALLNPHDRVAWLGVLRAPWCGLTLADLHTLVSADEEALLKRPTPELMADRAELLSEEGRRTVLRVLDVLAGVSRLRFAQPSVSLGTWLEQVWLRLGGNACVDAAARANVELLWRCLDSLPEGEQDLLGPALNAALKDLKALPDPFAENDYGVQMMTIHAAKGLEFEVVIVPDLQAGVRPPERKLLTWMERGLAEPDESGEITEFLVAPIQTKGAERGKAKEFVDHAYREREKQEMRRLLYVAATRAREELHLFARPEYKKGKNGGLELAEPKESLLKTAWPALEEEVRRRFDEWRAARIAQEMAGADEEEATIEAIAASGEENLLVLPSPTESSKQKPTDLRRLPAYYETEYRESTDPAAHAVIRGLGRLYERHEGGLLSRALGKAVHALFQQLAQLVVTQPLDTALAALARLTPRIASDVRSIGVDPQQAGRIAAQALNIALKAAVDPQAQWILAPHAEAENEVRWTGVVEGSLRTVQVDRVFRAGLAPDAVDNDTWWIIDYKTVREDGLDPAAALPELRRIFAPQIEAYAKVLRNLRGADAPVRGGLYYPRMSLLDWWEL